MLRFIRATSDRDIAAAKKVRTLVFVDEQEVDPTIEHDQWDATAIHIVGYFNDQPIAAARIRKINQQGKIQRVAIIKEARQQGYGKAVMRFVETVLQDLDLDEAILNAQTHALKFYQDLGYQQASEPFYEAGIEHVKMIKKLNR